MTPEDAQAAPTRLARLRALLAQYPTAWHAGRTVGRTLYAGDGPDDRIGVMDHRDLAELVVLMHEWLTALLEEDEDG